MRAGVLLLLTAGSLLSVAVGCGPAALEPRAPLGPPALGAPEKVGPGYYLKEPPPGLLLPSDAAQKQVKPKVTSDFAGVPVSNDWWSSLIWQHDPKNPYSGPLYAHPLTLQAEAGGLGLGYPTKPEVNPRQYMYFHEKDLLVGLAGLKAPDTRVAGYSDWTVTAAWADGESELRATFGHGLPFVYFTRRGSAPARLVPNRKTARDGARQVDVWRKEGAFLGVSVDGHIYAAFAPSGAEWKADGDAFVSDLAGKDFFSVALLPDSEPETIALFKAHAFSFVTDSKVSWKYDSASATLRSTFAVTTELQEPVKGRNNAPFSETPLLALYRHQWLNTKTPLTEKSYLSPRGAMKLLVGSSFVTEQRFTGVLPILPNVAENNRGDLEFYVKEVYFQDELFPPGIDEARLRDAYWEGKNMLKLAHVLQIADQVGYTSARDHLLQALKNEFEDWFDGREPRGFYYDKTWRTLISVPENFFSSSQLNDHHFHYGYFAFAAAVIARYDPAWAERWKDAVDLLMKDAANHERSDRRFPFLRYMDVYAGHSWANGPALFAEGNNEEASSEDMNLSAALILWGAATGDIPLRDLGIFLYTQQAAAIEQYWWDIDDQVFPKGFDHSAVAMVWGAGGRYDTWWDPNPIYVHGINFIPASAGSLYMGRHPDYVLRNYGEIERRNQGDPLVWRDVSWMYLAFADPERALGLFEDGRHFSPEFGNSRAMTYHFISNLAALGRVDTTVTADVATYAVFRKDKSRTRVAFNPGASPREVRFSDGSSLRVRPRQIAVSTTEN